MSRSTRKTRAWTSTWAILVVAGTSILASSEGNAHTPLPRTSAIVANAATELPEKVLPGLCGELNEAVTALPGACTHGVDKHPGRQGEVRPGAVGTRLDTYAPRAAYGCHGDGASGTRIQYVYAYVEGRANRSGALAGDLRIAAEKANAVFTRSAQQTSGTRAIRAVTDSSCKVGIMVARLPVKAETSFDETIRALQAQGYTRSDRKYVVWADTSQLCGVATMHVDDRSSHDNANNVNGGYARIDTRCWGGTVEAHEIAHMLGSVQPTAPRATRGLHCTDGHDRMCYSDGTATSTTTKCSSEHARLLDCGKDDYFHTNPAAGSWLAAHWNVAASRYLAGAPGMPGAVASLSARTAQKKVALSWGKAAGGVTGYRVYKNGKVLGTTTSLGGMDTTPVVGTENTYQVAAYNLGGEGPRSSVKIYVPNVPQTPSGVSAAAGDRSVEIKWTASKEATSYLVYRNNTLVKEVVTSSLKDTGLQNGTRYTYTVRARNVSGASGHSAPAAATPDTLLGRVLVLTPK